MLTDSLSGMTAGRALDFHLVDQLLDHAALFHAGGLAAKLHRHADLDHLVLGDAREIDVEHVRPPGVPLELADERRFVDRAGQRSTSRLPCRMAPVRASAATLNGTHSRPCP